MQDQTLDGLLSDLTGVLSAAIASEELWLGQLRRLRLNQPGGSPPSGSAMTSHFPPQPQRVEAPVGASRGDVEGTQSVRMSPPSQSSWPTNPDGDPVVAAAAKRNYDFFAELDEKLAGLRQRNLGSRGD